ncbi:hypothetical protein HBB16_03770 [Pseudonocardia sp. MCCB 268]|nr:hypothetical protein [Pseudonocardia cytotoxica]
MHLAVLRGDRAPRPARSLRGRRRAHARQRRSSPSGWPQPPPRCTLIMGARR